MEGFVPDEGDHPPGCLLYTSPGKGSGDSPAGEATQGQEDAAPAQGEPITIEELKKARLDFAGAATEKDSGLFAMPKGAEESGWSFSAYYVNEESRYEVRCV